MKPEGDLKIALSNVSHSQKLLCKSRAICYTHACCIRTPEVSCSVDINYSLSDFTFGRLFRGAKLENHSLELRALQTYIICSEFTWY